MRTEILFDDDEILEIYHLGRKATEKCVGESLDQGASCMYSI